MQPTRSVSDTTSGSAMMSSSDSASTAIAVAVSDVYMIAESGIDAVRRRIGDRMLHSAHIIGHASEQIASSRSPAHEASRSADVSKGSESTPTGQRLH
jgi:hypothetical protein